MKRTIEKTPEHQVVSLLSLSPDVLSRVMKYLKFGVIIMLSVSCSTIYKKIELILNSRQHSTEEPRSIASLLREKQKSKITVVSDDDRTNFIERFSRQTGGVVELEVVTIKISEDIRFSESPLCTMQLPVVTGFAVKHLDITWCSCYREDLFLLLSNMPNIKSLEAGSMEDGHIAYGTKIPRVNQVIIPVLSKLTSISFLETFFYESGDHVFYLILQLAPNLKKFKYKYMFTPCDQLLKHMAKYNPKLEEFHIVSGEPGCPPLEHEITDQGVEDFLSSMKNLKSLTLYSGCEISGKLFTNIGEFASNLECLTVERFVYEADLVPEYEKIIFGGGVMSKLQELRIEGNWVGLGDNFVDTLIISAPNLKRLHLNINERSRENMELISTFSASNLRKLADNLDLEVLEVPKYWKILDNVPPKLKHITNNPLLNPHNLK